MPSYTLMPSPPTNGSTNVYFFEGETDYDYDCAIADPQSTIEFDITPAVGDAIVWTSPWYSSPDDVYALFTVDGTEPAYCNGSNANFLGSIQLSNFSNTSFIVPSCLSNGSLVKFAVASAGSDGSYTRKSLAVPNNNISIAFSFKPDNQSHIAKAPTMWVQTNQDGNNLLNYAFVPFPAGWKANNSLVITRKWNDTLAGPYMFYKWLNETVGVCPARTSAFDGNVSFVNATNHTLAPPNGTVGVWLATWRLRARAIDHYCIDIACPLLPCATLYSATSQTTCYPHAGVATTTSAATTGAATTGAATTGATLTGSGSTTRTAGTTSAASTTGLATAGTSTMVTGASNTEMTEMTSASAPSATETAPLPLLTKPMREPRRQLRKARWEGTGLRLRRAHWRKAMERKQWCPSCSQ